MVKVTAFPAAAWVVGVKKLDAPLIWAALSQPELEMNKLKPELLVISEIVMPGIEDAALDFKPPVKLKFAKVAAGADEKPKITARLSHLSGVVIMGGETGG